MKKIIRYSFPIITGIVTSILFTSTNEAGRAFITGFSFWAIMELAGRLNET